MRTKIVRGCVLLFLAIYGFLVVPGHTYLQADSQIYVPMLERISNQDLYARDPMVRRQHVSLTAFDEIARSAKAVTGANDSTVLGGLQFACRVAGLYGLYLVGTAFGLAEEVSLLLAAIVGLGAVVTGPAVLTFEYEPIPRGLAVPLVFLSLGLALHSRSALAAMVGGLAFLLHPPAALPFLMPFAFVQLRAKGWRPLAILTGALLLWLLLAVLQAGNLEKQPLLLQMSPEWARLDRMRAAYNWLATWPPKIFVEFALHGVLAFAAIYRLRDRLLAPQRGLLLGTLVLGLLSLPLAYLLMDRAHWALMAQVQPARSVLYVVFLSQTLCLVAGLHAVREHRLKEAFLWLYPPLLTAIDHYLVFDFPWRQNRIVAVLALLVLTIAFARYMGRGGRFAVLSIPALTVFAGWLYLGYTKQTNYMIATDRQLDQVADWVRSHTREDALIHLPTEYRSTLAGIFRVRSQRALYVDWKSGAQVNYSPDFAREWARRMSLAETRSRSFSWAREGVDYLVARRGEASQEGKVVFRNSGYEVYALRP